MAQFGISGAGRENPPFAEENQEAREFDRLQSPMVRAEDPYEV